MEDIRIYDFEFNLLKIIHDCTSSNWTINYNDIGTWEGHFPENSKISDILNCPYLVAIQGSKQCIITSYQIDNEITLFGRTVNWILKKRTVPEFNLTEGNVSKLTTDMVNSAFSDVSNFEVQGNNQYQTSFEAEREKRTELFTTVKEILELDSAGHDVYFDVTNKKWIFRILNGTTILKELSERNKNAHDVSQTYNMLDLSTGGYYEQKNEDTDTTEWIYISNDADKKGIYKWDAVLSGGTQNEAETSLSELKSKKETACTADGLSWGVDYTLGDIVTVEKNHTKTQMRITSINIWYESNNIGEEPILEAIN